MNIKTSFIRKNILLDWLYKQGREIEVSELQKFMKEVSIENESKNHKKDG